MGVPAATTTPPPAAPTVHIGDLVETDVVAMVLIDLDINGDHEWILLDHPDPDRIGQLIRRPVTPDCRVIGREPTVALAARAQRPRLCATCSTPTDGRHWCSESCRRADEGPDE